MPTGKKLTGQSNLTIPTIEENASPKERLNLTTPKQKKPKLKNFLLTDLDRERLTNLVNDANQASPYKKISETAIIRALLLLGGKMDIEKIVKAAREA